MQTREIIGFALIPLVLIAAAVIINAFHLWSFLSNLTIPWLLTAIAIAVLLLGVACLTGGRSPVELPLLLALSICIGIEVIYGVGIFVDWIGYGGICDWPVSVAEWVGFGVILFATFTLPRLCRRRVNDK